MQIITCAVIKGGTGKTATCAALAQAGASEGRRVLCVDLDPQANLTALFGADKEAPGAADLMQGAEILETIQKTAQGVDIIGGNTALAIDSEDKRKKGSVYALSEALEPVKRSYDLIIIDTPPAFGNLTYNALQAANGLLVPVCADMDSYNGLQYILDVVSIIRKTNRKLRVLGCIITQYNPRPKISQYMRDIFEAQGRRLKCELLGEIRQGVAVQEARALNKNLFKYAPKSKPAQDYMQLYKKIIK